MNRSLTAAAVIGVTVAWFGTPAAAPPASWTPQSAQLAPSHSKKPHPHPSPSSSVSPSSSPTPVPSSSPSPSPSSSSTSPSPTSSASPVGGFPNADNTGVPDGTTLTPYTGPCTITVAGTVLDAVEVFCDLRIAAAGVVITRSRVHGEVNGGEDTGSSFTIADSEVINPARSSCQCVGSDNFTVLRVEIAGGNRGVYCRWQCTVQDSWIHGQQLLAMQHASAVRVEQYSTIVHNTLACDWTAITDPEIGCSADLTGYPDFAPIHHNTIRSNFFAANPDGLGFCAYGGGTGGKPYSSDPVNATYVVFVGNVFARGWNGLCGKWGPITDFVAGRVGNVWTGNVYDDGTVVNPA